MIETLSVQFSYLISLPIAELHSLKKISYTLSSHKNVLANQIHNWNNNHKSLAWLRIPAILLSYYERRSLIGYATHYLFCCR